MGIEIGDIALVILLAASLGLIAKFLKQPMIVAYIATGLLASYFGIVSQGGQETLRVFSDLGIMFLLFLVGLEINYTSLRLVGKASLTVGLAQVFFTAIIGYGITLFLGFSAIESLYIAVALTFSSTVIIVKILTEKRDLNSLYGKISVGALLVQDVIAIFILVGLSSIGTGEGQAFQNLFLTLIKGVALLGVMFYLGRTFIPSLFNRFTQSQEVLFLASLAWLFLIVAAVNALGFSIEIAGFLAGLALANSWEKFQISHYVRPLRDFFLLIFFVILGSSLIVSNISAYLFPVILLSLFVLIGNPFIVMAIMGFLGYRKRTGFLTGLTVAQISEFSFILALLGVKLGHIPQEVLGVITMIGIVTIVISTYGMMHANLFYKGLAPFLSVFEKKGAYEYETDGSRDKRPILLAGFHRIGKSVALHLPKNELTVVDFDPEIAKELKEKGYRRILGDITDTEVLEKAGIENVSILISTSPDFSDTMALLTHPLVKSRGENLIRIVRAETEEDARVFYKEDADYVLLPHLTSGYYLGKILSMNRNRIVLEPLKQKDLALIERTI